MRHRNVILNPSEELTSLRAIRMLHIHFVIRWKTRRLIIIFRAHIRLLAMNAFRRDDPGNENDLPLSGLAGRARTFELNERREEK